MRMRWIGLSLTLLCGCGGSGPANDVGKVYGKVADGLGIKPGQVFIVEQSDTEAVPNDVARQKHYHDALDRLKLDPETVQDFEKQNATSQPLKPADFPNYQLKGEAGRTPVHFSLAGFNTKHTQALVSTEYLMTRTYYALSQDAQGSWQIVSNETL